MVVPALPALLPRSPDDAVDGDHVLFNHRPVSGAMLGHELPYGVVVVLRPRASTSWISTPVQKQTQNQQITKIKHASSRGTLCLCLTSRIMSIRKREEGSQVNISHTHTWFWNFGVNPQKNRLSTTRTYKASDYRIRCHQRDGYPHGDFARLGMHVPFFVVFRFIQRRIGTLFTSRSAVAQRPR